MRWTLVLAPRGVVSQKCYWQRLSMEINGEACPIVSIIEKYVFHF
jgi:hypothetical protein